MAEMRVLAQILNPDIVTSDKAGFPIDDHSLSVVAVVQLKPEIRPALLSRICHVNPCISHGVQIRTGQTIAAHGIGHETDVNTPIGGRDQFGLKLLTQSVVTDDVELNKNITLCAVYCLKNRVECGPTIDQKLGSVTTGDW